MKAVLWDLDSTLCNTMQRQSMVPLIRAKQGPTWLDYSMACADDEPVEGAVALVRFVACLAQAAWMHTGEPDLVRQYGVSGRNASAEMLTRQWLQRYKVPLDDVFLRPDNDYTPNGEYKVRVINQLRESGIEVVLLVDDWRETAEFVTAETGVPVLVVKGVYAEDVTGAI